MKAIFIELTIKNSKGRKVLINVNKMQSITEGEMIGSVIDCGNYETNFYQVNETVEEIKELIKIGSTL